MKNIIGKILGKPSAAAEYGGMAMQMLMQHAGYLPVALKAMARLKGDTERNFRKLLTQDNCDSISDEWTDMIARADWLCRNVIVEPQKLIDAMPEMIGRMYQGEWAIYACSMTAFALCNLMRRDPSLKEKYLDKVDALIRMVLSPEIRYYDTMQWMEDALETLDGPKSHMTYLSILAWMITNYRQSGGDGRHDTLLSQLCSTLARRMKESHDFNLPSFPNGVVFLPDMMFTIISLKNYGRLHDGEYDGLVDEWLRKAKNDWIDPKTGLLVSLYYRNGRRGKMQGSYSALNCTCLTLIDEEFARRQYGLLKKHFAKYGKYCGIREWLDSSPQMSFHIDAGPIIMGLSPTGISFALGAATNMEDWSFRKGLLNSAELAGKTVRKGNEHHYRLAEVMLTGEAITLGMRTNFRE